MMKIHKNNNTKNFIINILRSINNLKKKPKNKTTKFQRLQMTWLWCAAEWKKNPFYIAAKRFFIDFCVHWCGLRCSSSNAQTLHCHISEYLHERLTHPCNTANNKQEHGLGYGFKLKFIIRNLANSAGRTYCVQFKLILHVCGAMDVR